MESNGMYGKAESRQRAHQTASVTRGGTGTNATHAVFQPLHQGTVLVPLEVVAVQKGEDDQDSDHHHLHLLNAFAQGAALMQGWQSDDPQRSYPGNRPSVTL